MKALIPPKELEELTIALVVESPERKKKGKRLLDLSPEEEATVLKEEQDLKALCEKLDGRIFQIRVIQDSSSKRVAAISFQKT
jgi:ribosome assembly protein YihI (activator of Der GTPase)